MKIIADAHIPYAKEYFGAYGELITKSGRDISAADVKDADILLVRSITPVNEQLLSGSKVKFVGSVTAGADHLDREWLDKVDIAWNVATGFNAPPVADYVVSVIAALQRKQMLVKNRLKAAVIGVGNVGRLVVNYLTLLGFHVTLCDPIRAAQETDFISTPLAELSDFDLISLHVPLTRSGLHPTFHLLDKDFLQRQKTGCVLLNACRGAVIKTEDILQYGQHLQWCIDVWEDEPNINTEVLADACIATPHIAGYSIQSKIRGIDMIYQLACDRKIIAPQARIPINIPTQDLSFADKNLTWQDVILGIFNPSILTEMMQVLVDSKTRGAQFDNMRNQFQSRYEFNYTRIGQLKLTQHDRELLKNLGVVS